MNARRIGELLLPNRRTVLFYLLLVSVIVFSVHYFVFWSYITDDAGITFGSAKTLVDHGRFSIDRFAETVEAYSNALWMLLLAGAYSARVPIPLAAKVMTYILGLVTLLAAYLINSRYGKGAPGWANALSPLMLAVMTGFVLWGAAGLENGLYAFLTAGLLYGCLQFDKSAKPVLITLFAFLISVVRPEGILLAAFAYLGLFAAMLLDGRRGYRKLFISAFLVAVLYGLFLLGRYYVFAWLVPNTYYAKVSTSLSGNLKNGLDYTGEFAKAYWSLFLLAAVLLVLGLILGRARYGTPKHRHRSGSWFARSNRVIWYSMLILLANLVYVFYVGGAFFGRDRFFTPMLVCLAVVLTELFKSANLLPAHEPEEEPGPELEKKRERKREKKRKRRLEKKPERRRLFLIPQVVVAMVLVFLLYQMGDGSAAAYKAPWVPFEGIKARHADWGNQVGGYLVSNGYLPNAKHVPYMVPDIGATSYYAENYTIIDSAKLGNVPLAHNDYEPASFREYVFNATRPVLIETHGSWSYFSAIGLYDEFTKHYELVTGRGTDRYGGVDVPSGYFIRTDIFKGNASSSPRMSDGNLILNRHDINALRFSPDGEMQLDTYWQRSSGTTEAETIDNHMLRVYLETPENQYLLDEHRIAGGYYLPSKWDAGSEIVDRRAISVGDVPDGNYTLVVGVTYPDKTMDAVLSVDIEIVPSSQGAATALVEDFNYCLSRNDDLGAKTALGRIRGLDSAAYRACYDIYVGNRLGLIEGLLNNDQPSEAYQMIYPLAGFEAGDEVLNSHLRRTETEVSRSLEQEGQQLESQGANSQAIAVYEKAMWLDPGNSHLRRHIEAIRPRPE